MFTVKADPLSQLEAICGTDVETFLIHVTPANLRHNDNAEALSLMAQQLGLSEDALSTFAEAKLHAKQLAEGDDDVEVPYGLIASLLKLGVTREQFCVWLAREVEDFSKARADFLEELQSDGGAILDGE